MVQGAESPMIRKPSATICTDVFHLASLLTGAVLIRSQLQAVEADGVVPVNLAGVPAISVPMGHVTRDDHDLPIGFQLIAPWRPEETLFAIGSDIEKA